MAAKTWDVSPISAAAMGSMSKMTRTSPLTWSNFCQIKAPIIMPIINAKAEGYTRIAISVDTIDTRKRWRLSTMLNMSLKNMIEAQRFATQLLHKPKLWLLLVVLNVIPVLDILALGYFARVAAEITQEPPPLRPLGRTFVLGLKVLAVMLIYGILLIGLLTLLLGLSFAIAMPMAYGLYSNPLVVAYIVLAAVLLAVVLLAVLGVPIALVLAARRGVLAALNPANSWRIIRRAGVGEYIAFIIVATSFGLLSFLPAVGAVLFDVAGYVAFLILLALAMPLIGAFLWRWGGLIVEQGTRSS